MAEAQPADGLAATPLRAAVEDLGGETAGEAAGETEDHAEAEGEAEAEADGIDVPVARMATSRQAALARARGSPADVFDRRHGCVLRPRAASRRRRRGDTRRGDTRRGDTRHGHT